MRLLLRKIVVISLLGTFLVGLGVSRVLAQEATEVDEISEQTSEPIVSDAVRNAYLMIKLRQYLQQSERNFQSLQDKMDLTREEIEENRYTIDTLDGQITQLDKLIEETDVKILNVQTQIAEKEQEIRDSLETLELSEIRIEEQKAAAASYARLIYFEDNLNSSSNLETNFLKMFFLIKLIIRFVFHTMILYYLIESNL